MKKFAVVVIVAVLMALFPNVRGASGDIVLYLGSNSALVSGEETVIDKDKSVIPVFKNATVYVPVRFIAESAGMTVSYEEKEEKIDLKSSENSVSFNVGADVLTVNGKKVELNGKISFVHQSRSYLPLRAFCEAIGKNVHYDKGLIVIGNSENKSTDAELDALRSSLSGLEIVGSKESLEKKIPGVVDIDIAYDITLGGGSGGGSGSVTGTAVQESASAPVASSSANIKADYSETNIQVEGIDEADIVKTDGNYIYSVQNGNVYITDINPAVNMAVSSVIKSEENETPGELYADGDILTVIYTVFDNNNQKHRFYTNEKILCKVFDVSNRENPVVSHSYTIDGQYVSSRKTADTVYLVTTSRLWKESGEIILPCVRDYNFSKEEQELDLAACYYLPEKNYNSFVTVSSFNVTKPDEKVKVKSWLGGGQEIYMSADNLYIASASGNETNIYKFALDSGEVIYTANSTVEGALVNQFSMDEYNGNFRIATTYFNESYNRMNGMYIFDCALTARGSVTEIAPTEQIYSVRFVGNRGYMVTFRNTDPLFVLDLSDIDNPKILGKLKIPGYSTYLHPVDEKHILGFGVDTKEVGSTVYTGGMKMALFDVSDVANPTQKFVEIIGERNTSSPLTNNHKALLYMPEKNLLAFPVYEYGVDYGEQKPVAKVYSFSTESGFDLRGEISQISEEDILKSGDNPYFPHRSIERIIYANNALFTLSSKKIQANSFENLEYISHTDL